ncbi:AraC family transcriptional regulator [Paenibacillus sp. IHBB 10380]|uniref:AraC family transcriptional regulator n=1 Tax=Paenibacillus sp. IHBB 10380 TaxID=1566358 RepID=UPI0005CF957A|nr:AraC family transcriptional regulator [Paenibacillus sp. IHBB 10380]AJS57598.1 hypothetical protein UB51_02850 [Paenibacillus sp. IHBB 10380]
MNTITYELQDARMLVDKGTLSPTALILSFVAIIVPTEAIVLRSASAVYKVEKGKFIVLQHAEADMSIEPADMAEFAPVYAVVFQSYQLTERTDNSLLYHIHHEHLPEQGSVMEFPRHSFVLLQNLMEQLRQALWIQIAPRLNLMLDELLRSILVSNVYGTSFMTHEPAIQRALSYMNQHFDASITRSFMARMTGFNPSYFSSLFRKETGWSFADASYLGKMFRKMVGLTPSAFRQRRGAERIVGMQFLGALLAVGIKPVASTLDVLRSSLLLHEELDGITEMEEMHTVEVLKPLAPELILAPTYYYNYPDALKALESIAPVIMLDWGTMDKMDEVRVIGSLLGRSIEAERWIFRLQQKALTARQLLRLCIAPHETVGLYEMRHDQRWLIPHDSVRSVFNLYRLLKLAPPSRTREEVLDPAKHLFIREQDLPGYAADHMFLIVPGGDTEVFKGRMMTHGIWQQLAQEQGCNFYLLQLEEFWMDEGVSLEKQMDIVVDMLTSGQRSLSEENNVLD